MAEIARITALALTLLFLGLATPNSRASTAECVPDGPGLQARRSAGKSTGKSGERVVSQRKMKSEEKTSKAEQTEVPGNADGPMGVFSDIEEAWKENDVEAILQHFGRGKVTISIAGPGPSGGQFSKNQSYYLLKDLFKYTITRKFEFVQYRKPNKKGNATFAVAERHYQKTDDGRLFKDKIYVSLHLESSPEDKPANQRWVVDEIKSIR